jgi:hypothetical protein
MPMAAAKRQIEIDFTMTSRDGELEMKPIMQWVLYL